MKVVYERAPLQYQIEALDNTHTAFVADKWYKTGDAFADLEDAKEFADTHYYIETVRFVDIED